jgi:hypothetical protein
MGRITDDRGGWPMHLFAVFWITLFFHPMLQMFPRKNQFPPIRAPQNGRFTLKK